MRTGDSDDKVTCFHPTNHKKYTIFDNLLEFLYHPSSLPRSGLGQHPLHYSSMRFVTRCHSNYQGRKHLRLFSIALSERLESLIFTQRKELARLQTILNPYSTVITSESTVRQNLPEVHSASYRAQLHLRD